LTPTSGNPTFRVYTVDPATFGVLGYNVYYAIMSLPDYQIQGPIWEKYYSVKDTYGRLLNPPCVDPAAELSPAFWHNVTQLFVDNDAVFKIISQGSSEGMTRRFAADHVRPLRFVA
jgi:sphingomyelin phosphodiesterase